MTFAHTSKGFGAGRCYVTSENKQNLILVETLGIVHEEYTENPKDGCWSCGLAGTITLLLSDFGGRSRSAVLANLNPT